MRLSEIGVPEFRIFVPELGLLTPSAGGGLRRRSELSGEQVSHGPGPECSIPKTGVLFLMTVLLFFLSRDMKYSGFNAGSDCLFPGPFFRFQWKWCPHLWKISF